MVKCNRTRSWV